MMQRIYNNLTFQLSPSTDDCRYGGVVRRPKIAAAADWYIDEFSTLIKAL